MVGFQSTLTSVGRSLWNRSCGDRNCSRRATVPLLIDTLIANILVLVCFLSIMLSSGRACVRNFVVKAFEYGNAVDITG